MKAADFIKTPLAVECVEVVCVARRELAGLEIAGTQICIAKCLRALTREEVKTQTAPVHARTSLRFSKERDKQKENKIGIDLRLELQIACKIFGGNLADSALELKCRMQCMVEFLHERDERADIAIAHACPGIVLFELLNEPARIVNADVKLIARAPQKCAGELT